MVQTHWQEALACHELACFAYGVQVHVRPHCILEFPGQMHESWTLASKLMHAEGKLLMAKLLSRNIRILSRHIVGRQRSLSSMRDQAQGQLRFGKERHCMHDTLCGKAAHCQLPTGQNGQTKASARCIKFSTPAY